MEEGPHPTPSTGIPADEAIGLKISEICAGTSPEAKIEIDKLKMVAKDIRVAAETLELALERDVSFYVVSTTCNDVSEAVSALKAGLSVCFLTIMMGQLKPQT
jgi:hypothetical protein